MIITNRTKKHDKQNFKNAKLKQNILLRFVQFCAPNIFVENYLNQNSNLISNLHYIQSFYFSAFQFSAEGYFCKLSIAVWRIRISKNQYIWFISAILDVINVCNYYIFYTIFMNRYEYEGKLIKIDYDQHFVCRQNHIRR